MAQRRDGTFKDTPWTINDNHALIWGGNPYVPSGLRIDGTAAAVTSGAQADIHDFIVDLPVNGAGWAETLNALETNKSRYLIRLNSMAPMCAGFAIEPQGYRISNITEPRTIRVDIPGATSAFVVLASQRDGKVNKKERIPVINGKLEYLADSGTKLPNVLLIFPEMVSLSQPDYWEDFDAHRDTLLNTLEKAPLSAGLRGIVDPLGRTSTLVSEPNRFVPTGDLFRLELRNFLEQKYKSVQTLTRSWSITSSDLQSFDTVARLVPLWNGERGIPALLDPKTNKIYNSDRKFSSAWTDIQSVMDVAAAKRYARLVDAIRDVADVPVIQEWNGWALPYESEVPELDGIGMRSTGTTPSQIIESACRSTSSILRWKTRGWLVATDIDLGDKDAASQVGPVISDLGSLGARGFFIRSGDPAVMAAVSKSTPTDIMSLPSPTAVFYPENATNPANPQRLVNGNWWLPTPAAGNRIDLGTMFFAYRTADQTAIWAKTPGRYKLKMKEPKLATFTSVDGSDPKPKFGKTDVEVNLTQMPLIVNGTSEIPIPELAYREVMKEFNDLLGMSEMQHRETSSEKLVFADHLRAFDTDPGANFPILKETVYALGNKASDYLWIEAERVDTANTNFSEIDNVPGASGRAALVLDTRIDSGEPNGYYAEYKIPVLSKADQEVWVAARIPEERRGDVSILIGDQLMPMPKEYSALYGQGLAWYKLGTTKLQGNLSTVRVQVNSAGAPIAIDAIVLTPVPFTPSATTPPMPVIQLPAK